MIVESIKAGGRPSGRGQVGALDIAIFSCFFLMKPTWDAAQRDAAQASTDPGIKSTSWEEKITSNYYY